MDALWASQMQAVRLFFHGHQRCPSRFRWNAYPMSRGTASASPNLRLRAPQSEVVGGSDPDTRHAFRGSDLPSNLLLELLGSTPKLCARPLEWRVGILLNSRSEFDNERRVCLLQT